MLGLRGEANKEVCLASCLKDAAELYFAQERALKKARNEVRELREASCHATLRVEKLEALQKESMRQSDSELAAKMDLVARQQAAILALSTSIIAVMDGVLVLPIIGAIDDERAQNLADNVLTEIKRARYTILDLTGVPALDPRTARLLSRVASAVRLLGAETPLSGMSPQVARELFSLGEGVTDLLTTRSLKEALRYCTRRDS